MVLSTNVSNILGVINKEVPKKINKDEEIVTTINKSKLQYFGHMRGARYELLSIIMIVKSKKNQVSEEEKYPGSKMLKSSLV